MLNGASPLKLNHGFTAGKQKGLFLPHIKIHANYFRSYNITI